MQIQTTGVVLLTVICRLFQTFVLLVGPRKNAVQSRPTSTVAVMMFMYWLDYPLRRLLWLLFCGAGACISIYISIVDSCMFSVVCQVLGMPCLVALPAGVGMAV